MKRFIKYIFICLLALLVSGCMDTPVSNEFFPSTEACYLQVGSTSYTFSAESDSQVMNVRSSHTWNISDYASWLSFSDLSGSGQTYVSIMAEENLSADIARSSIFFLNMADQGWSHRKAISADQAASTPYIRFAPESLVAAGGASVNKIQVSSNTKWTANCTANWVQIAVAEDGGSFDVILSENLTKSTRSADVILTGATTERFQITQNIAMLTPETNYLKYSQGGGSYLLKITSEVAWTAFSSNSWIELSKTEGGLGDHEIAISVTPNYDTKTRNGFVEFTLAEDRSAQILIIQDGVGLSVEGDVVLKALGGCELVNVEANTSWKVKSKPSWVNVSPDAGEGSCIVAISADNNSQAYSRSGVVVFGKDGVSHTAEVNVTQDGKYFSVNNEALSIGSTGGTLQVSIETNDSWDISLKKNVDWLSYNFTNGKESATIDFVAADNPSVNPRSETATISSRDLNSIDVVIRQDARYLTVDAEGVYFFSKGGVSQPVKVSTDGQYVVSEDVDWFSIQQDGDFIYVIADMNATGHRRDGELIVTLTDLAEGQMWLNIPVVQYAPGGAFSKEDYIEDSIWDAECSNGFNLSVIGYAADDSWDEPFHNGFQLNVEGYIGDDDWDGIFGSGDMDKEEFPDDGSHDESYGSGDMDKTDFPEDDNYDDDEVE